MKRLNGKVMAEPQPWLGACRTQNFRHHTKDAYGFLEFIAGSRHMGR